MDHDVIIVTAGRGPLDRQPICRDNLLDSLQDQDFMLMRARCNVNIIATMNYIRDFGPSFAAVTDLFIREIT